MFRITGNTLTYMLAWVGFCLAGDTTGMDAVLKAPSRCIHERVHSMSGANCEGLKLYEVPSLRGGIEILDFSSNSLLEIKADTFSTYTSLRFLYLADNKIMKINDNALTYLTSLQTLDLSKNALDEIPSSILQLPSLRDLNLAFNPIVTLVYNIKKPIAAPLTSLDLSYCKLKMLPDLGNLPYLRIYNVSNNPLQTFEAPILAQSCSLQKIHIANSLDSIQICNIKESILWLKENNIDFQLENYDGLNSKEFSNCIVKERSTTLNSTKQQCMSEIKESLIQVPGIVSASGSNWLRIGGSLAGFLVGFMLLLFILHRINVALIKRNEKKPPAPNTDKLLNDVS